MARIEAGSGTFAPLRSFPCWKFHSGNWKGRERVWLRIYGKRQIKAKFLIRFPDALSSSLKALTVRSTVKNFPQAEALNRLNINAWFKPWNWKFSKCLKLDFFSVSIVECEVDVGRGKIKQFTNGFCVLCSVDEWVVGSVFREGFLPRLRLKLRHSYGFF